ncbi:TPA: terminase endonuclease subunit, partial [Salmonella enterica subsp. enterica serovar Weltevreden]|nr:terminase endonuclease subunit [Salmonella enterica subsp. enterica serovar Weltevreden]
MTSPAQRHMMRVSASQAAQREQAPLRHATAYEQMLVKLADDRRTLKNIRSNERKAEKKRELLQFYAPWVAGVLTDGRGAQDDIVMTVMLWRLDAGDIAGALEIAPYALKYGLTSDHRRTTPYMLVEEVALAALRLRDAGESVDLSWLQTTIDLTDGADVPDMVRARLHKVTGLTLRDVGMNAEALAQFQRAMQLDRNAGVRKEIERLERALKPKAEAPPRKTTKPRTR